MTQQTITSIDKNPSTIPPQVLLSRYFTFGEAIRSQTAARRGINNVPTIEIAQNILITAHLMDFVRALLGYPIIVTSWYRSPELNRAIGGAETSQHLTGRAVDFVCPQAGTPAQIVRRIMSDGSIAFDQLILEFPNSPAGGWVHISFAGAPRKQALLIDQSGTKVLA